MKSRKHIFFLKLDPRYLVTCAFEIVYQQTLVIAGIALLASKGVSTQNIIIFFAVGFGLLHTPMFFLGGALWGAYFTIAGVLAGIIFPCLIMHFSQGYIYTFLVHWEFYTLMGVVFWKYGAVIKKRTTTMRKLFGLGS